MNFIQQSKHENILFAHRNILTALALLVICLCALCVLNESDSSDASAHSGTAGECEWTISNNDTTLKISGDGALPNYTAAKNAPWYTYHNSITNVIVDDGVTSIGAYSFRGYKALDSVILPDSVQTLGKYAFDGTSIAHIEFGIGLKTIKYHALNGLSFYMPDGTKLSITADNLSGCTYDNMNGKLTVTYDRGTTGDLTWVFRAETGTLTFNGAGAMPNYTAAKNTPWYAYRNNISEVSIGNGVTSIGAYSFRGYTSLETVYLSDTVSSIGKYAFDGTGVTCITFGTELTSIKYHALNGLSFHMPDGSKMSVTPANLAGREFRGTEGDLTLCYTWGYFGDLIWSLDFENGTFCIDGDGAMPAINNYAAPWSNFRAYIEKLSVDCTTVSAYAFRNCTNLQEVIFSDNVTTVMKYAFQNDTSMTHVEFGEHMTSISAVAFPYKFYGSASSNMALTDSSVAAYAWDLTAVGSTYKYLKSANLHDQSDAVIENFTDSTCIKKGSYESVVYCSECGKELSREKITIPLKEHTPVVDEAVPATTTTTGLTQGSHCSVCGKILVEQEVVDIVKAPEFTTGYAKLNQAEIIDNIIAGNAGAGYGCTSSGGSTYAYLPSDAEYKALYQYEDTGDEEWTWHTDHSKCIFYTSSFPYVYFYEAEYTAVSTEVIILDGYEITCDVYYGTDPTQDDYGLKHYGYHGYDIVTLNEDGSVKGIHYRFDNYQGILDDVASSPWQEYVMPIVHPEWCDVETSEVTYSYTGYNVGNTTVKVVMNETNDEGNIIYSYSSTIDYLEIDGVRHEGSELLKFLETFEPTEETLIGAKYGFTFIDCGHSYSLDMKLVRSNDGDEGTGIQDGNGEWDSFDDYLVSWWNNLLMKDAMAENTEDYPGFKYVDTEVLLGVTDGYLESTTGSPATKFEMTWSGGEGYIAYWEYEGQTIYAEMTDYVWISDEFESNEIKYTVTGVTVLGNDYNVRDGIELFSDIYIHLSNPVKIEYANITYQTEDGVQIEIRTYEVGSSAWIPLKDMFDQESYRIVSVSDDYPVGESFTMPKDDIVVTVEKMEMAEVIYQTEDGEQVYTESFEVGSEQAYIRYVCYGSNDAEQKSIKYMSISAPEGYKISDVSTTTYFTMPENDIVVTVEEIIEKYIIYQTEEGKQVYSWSFDAGAEAYISYSVYCWDNDAQTSIEYRSISASNGYAISTNGSLEYFSMPEYNIIVTVQEVVTMKIIYQTEDGTVLSNITFQTNFEAGSVNAYIPSTFCNYNGYANVGYQVSSVSDDYPIAQLFTMPNSNITVQVTQIPQYPETTASDSAAMKMIAEGTVSPGFGYYNGSVGYLVTDIADGTYTMISEKNGDWSDGSQSTSSSLGMIYTDYSSWDTKYPNITEEHTTATISGYECDVYTINGYRESGTMYIVYQDYTIVKYHQNTLSISGFISFSTSQEEILSYMEDGKLDVDRLVAGKCTIINTVYTYVYVPNYSDYLGDA